MKNLLRLGPVLFATALMTGHPDVAAADGIPALNLKPAWTTNLVLQRPLYLCESPDDTKRLCVVEQPGRVLILPADRASTNVTVFLDIRDRRPHRGNEEGLLGLAFHPQFRANGKVYLNYSAHEPARRSIVSEWTVSRTNRDQLDPASERMLMEVPQPFENHNGGATIFGPDGMLYIALGDGGAARDPHGNGQKLVSLLGKILRIDVNGRTGDLPYSVPRDNPFVGRSESRAEIWALGLRNPWGMSFDRRTGELYAADVGQDKWEEVCVITRGGNYGWNRREAFHDFDTNTVVAAGTRLIDPILEYPHNRMFDTNNPVGPGLSITGGFVYRGAKLPELQGVYTFGDYVTGTVWGLRHVEGRVTARGVITPHPRGLVPIRSVAGFGEDGAGELYLLAYEGQMNGRVYEFTRPAASGP